MIVVVLTHMRQRHTGHSYRPHESLCCCSSLWSSRSPFFSFSLGYAVEIHRCWGWGCDCWWAHDLMRRREKQTTLTRSLLSLSRDSRLLFLSVPVLMIVSSVSTHSCVVEVFVRRSLLWLQHQQRLSIPRLDYTPNPRGRDDQRRRQTSTSWSNETTRGKLVMNSWDAHPIIITYSSSWVLLSFVVSVRDFTFDRKKKVRTLSAWEKK